MKYITQMPVFQLQVRTITIVFRINTPNNITYQYLSLPWHALYSITLSYQRSCIMCMSASTTDIAVCYGAYVWIFMDEVFSDVCWETLETVSSNFFKKGYRNWVDHFRVIYSDSFISIKCPCAVDIDLIAMVCIVVVMRTLRYYLKCVEISG